MFEFDEEILKFKFKDEVCELSFPSAKRVNQYRKDSEAKKKDDYELTEELLIELGGKKEVIEKLSFKQMMKLIKVLFDTEDLKKN